MTRALIACLALVCAFTAAPAAVAQAVLVELFSSQNCRACPMAHKTLRQIADADPDVFVLTWSVDYWDYLGEADPMALTESKDRQLAYVERFDLRGPYTPQTVYDGVKQCPGNRPGEVRRNIDMVRAERIRAAVISRTPDGLQIEGGPETAGDLTLVEYLPDGSHDTTMRNPVTRVHRLSQFAGGEARLALPACSTACIVVLESAEQGVTAFLPLQG